jgi:hypothetical protein
MQSSPRIAGTSTSIDALLEFGRKSFRGVAFTTSIQYIWAIEPYVDDWWTKVALDKGKEKRHGIARHGCLLEDLEQVQCTGLPTPNVSRSHCHRQN